VPAPHYRWFHGTEPVATRDAEVNLVGKLLLKKLSLGSAYQKIGPACLAARARRDDNGRSIRVVMSGKSCLKCHECIYRRKFALVFH
jgi:hypothetical protein